MAKESGLGATLTIDDSGGTGRAITNDVGDVTIDISRGELQVPGLDVSSMERLLGLGDASVSFNGYFNDAAAPSIFDTVKTAASADVARTTVYALSGQTLSMEMHFTSVNFSRSRDGGMAISASLALQDGTDPTWS